jgi:hypothetical protein
MLPVMIDAGGALERPVRLRAVVLVEGLSDRIALEAVASRRGRYLSAEGVLVVDMGGATNVGRFLGRFGPPGLDVALTGLYDAAEEPDFRRALERVGLGSELSRADMERLRFFACVEDLEDELIRAIGADAVLGVIRMRGELGPFRTLSQQPEWRERPVDERLRRFLGNSFRKTEYAPLLVAALDLLKVLARSTGSIATSTWFEARVRRSAPSIRRIEEGTTVICRAALSDTSVVGS